MTTSWSEFLPLHWCAICCAHRVATPSTYLCPRCADAGLTITPLAPLPAPTWVGHVWDGRLYEHHEIDTGGEAS